MSKIKSVLGVGAVILMLASTVLRKIIREAVKDHA